MFCIIHDAPMAQLLRTCRPASFLSFLLFPFAPPPLSGTAFVQLLSSPPHEVQVFSLSLFPSG
ncbi:hypothetical protein TRIATDRAFT_297769 [Trichoderma atroviride IMI 206040]|uniref:Uncharacterized protein n=1 Tax=Hypocrea atroviridis (strain ATCC 20476 / IMI 206040) TaxID=452589 RepID=G9NJH2_HYPAI|nr:uncharacterized protein TRIATDRAFT_297769 [Trichoderma atroviride IMI 206040]EHK49046.1 hypothetical protein TRIATDRAFT_297769 [Trichoderma atroviride IMI 206040]